MKKEQIENLEEIKFNGKTIPLKSDRLKAVFKKIGLQQQVIAESKENGDKTLLS